MAARRGLRVTISNPSELGLKVIRRFANTQGARNIRFVRFHPTALEFPDRAFNVVVSSHVLEHLDDFDKGLAEIHRLTRDRAIIALPTCTNPAVICRLGGGDPYRFSIRSILGFCRGSVRVAISRVHRAEGVDEAMSELGTLIQHRWWFPKQMRRRITRAGFEIRRFEPDCVILPWFPHLLPIVEFLDRHASRPLICDLGMGSHAIVQPRNSQ
jgi:ubiquinone/menaquinone biosynthesis C-methylase UbiE